MAKKKISVEVKKVIRSNFDKLIDFYNIAIGDPLLSFSEVLTKAALTPMEFKEAYDAQKADAERFEEFLDYAISFDVRRSFAEGISTSEVKDACKLGSTWLESRFNLKKLQIEQQKLDAVIAQNKAERDSADDPQKFEVVLNL